METKKFINFSKQHLEPITEPNDCCIYLTPSDRQTKKCSHPICVECFYKLTDNDKKNIPCPIWRKVLVKRRRTRKKGISSPVITPFHTFNPLHHLPIISMNGSFCFDSGYFSSSCRISLSLHKNSCKDSSPFLLTML
jgi:hypothetical protein